jgi:hypothetical protein
LPDLERKLSNIIRFPLNANYISCSADEEAVWDKLLLAVVVPGAIWGSSCFFLMFIGEAPEEGLTQHRPRLLHQDR